MKQKQCYRRRKFELSLISKAFYISTFRGGLERALATDMIEGTADCYVWGNVYF